MSRVTILCGISGSGKSTYARNLVHSNFDKFVRVNRDKLREMMYGYSEADVKYYYNLGNLHILEDQVTKVEDALIESLLASGKNVVVDATHLQRKYLNRFSKFGVNTDIVYFDIELEEALFRNSQRERKVDESVIRKQFEQYKKLRNESKDINVLS